MQVTRGMSHDMLLESVAYLVYIHTEIYSLKTREVNFVCQLVLANQMARIAFLMCQRNDTSNQDPRITVLSRVKKFRFGFSAVACHVFGKF